MDIFVHETVIAVHVVNSANKPFVVTQNSAGLMSTSASEITLIIYFLG